MSELAPVLEELLHQAREGHPCALCTVVKTVGSAPQFPGAALLVRADRSTLGTLGGGCVEAEVVRRTHAEIMPRGEAVYMEYNLDHDWGWDDGLICGGRMDIAAMPITEDTDLEPFERALEASRNAEAAWFPVSVKKDGATVEYRVHLEPPAKLVIAGAGHVGQALAKLAGDLDFKVTVIDDRKEFASPERFAAGVELVVGDIAGTLETYALDAHTFVVIVTRGHKNDQRALEAVIDRPTKYIGLIGSKRKRKLIYDDIRARGIAQERLDEVHSPIGLSIGAQTVPEIAISILAELIEVRREVHPIRVEGPF